MSSSCLVADSLFLQTFRLAPIAMAVLSADYHVLMANPVLCRMLGYQEEELQGIRFDELLDRGSWSSRMDLSSFFVQGKALSFRTRGGESVRLNVSAFAAEQQRIFVLHLTPTEEIEFAYGKRTESADELQSGKVESMLMESELRYQSLFEYHSDAIFSIDLDGFYIEVNPAFEQLFGYTRDDLREFWPDYTVLSTPHELEKAKDYFLEAAKGRTQHFDMQCYNRQGETLDISLTYIPVVVEGRVTYLYGVCKDVTTQKRLLQELQESKRLCELISVNAQDVIVLSRPDGIVEYISPAITKLTGYQTEELVGRNYFSLLMKEDIEKIWSHYAAPGTDESMHTYRILHKDGSIVWFESSAKLLRDEDGRVQHVLSVARDITRRKQAEKALQFSEWKYRRLIEDLPDGILVHSNERIRYLNETGCRLLGVKNKEELLNRSIYDIIVPAYKRDVEDRIQLLRQGEKVPVRRQQFMTASGEPLDVEVHSLLMSYEGEPSIYVLFRDVSESQKTRELLQHSEKLTMVGQMAAGIAHEIRNPLTAIKGFIKLLQTVSGNKRSYWDIVTSEIERIEQILNELLVLAKPTAAQYKPEDLKTLLENVTTLIDSQAIMNNIEIVFDCEPNLPAIECDMNRLKQVFINFMKNGIEAMTQGGRLSVEVRRHAHDAVKVVIADQGCGIPPEKLARIGQPFFTTKEEGNGLGMMVSYKIIEDHNGKVKISSEVGVGTVIEILLPIGKETV
ncbi:PAS domain S-box protein [Paenibacillus filicis]|uniref:histidine kinase n=1 Tax=Paenibacillus gyeongsangnamensis TaxID=3388067 RepID=A0ABT4QFK2_9BACL|nr:PAS domain S-box protein [Paenibacillus filicis]MCZ8515572.1 PAS domain S-box protein [Paenibacillus filicis]